MRIGNGFDVHAIKEGTEVILGGVKIPAPFALEGYSDADVLLHALTDALLGALAEKDIGFYFPPGQIENKNRASHEFLLFAGQKVAEKGYQIENIDTTIICELPRIGPHREAIRANLCQWLKLAADQVSVKATTTEKLGFTGRGEGIAAMAVVLLSRAK